MNIVLVRQGDYYPAKYVAMLREMVGHDLWTLTDQADTPGNTIPLTHGFTGWWAKMELFAPENRALRPFLFLDLDTYVLGDISDILVWKPGRLAMLSDFYNPMGLQSAVMVVPDYPDGIWERFKPGDMNDPGGDQSVIGRLEPQAIRLQNVFDGIKSYKVHGPNKGRICCFHGQPKPHTADSTKHAWVVDVWNQYG